MQFQLRQFTGNDYTSEVYTTNKRRNLNPQFTNIQNHLL